MVNASRGRSAMALAAGRVMVIAESSSSGPAFASDATLPHPALIEALYSAVLLLEDDARHAFDPGVERATAGGGQAAGISHAETTLPISPAERIALACAALRLNIRLMQISEWLLARRQRCGTAAPVATQPLPMAPDEDAAALARLPEEAQRQVRASVRLYERVTALDRALRGASAGADVPVVRRYWQRLASAAF